MCTNVHDHHHVRLSQSVQNLVILCLDQAGSHELLRHVRACKSLWHVSPASNTNDVQVLLQKAELRLEEQEELDDPP